MKKTFYLFLILSFSAMGSTFAEGYKIEIKVNGVSDTIAYLGTYIADNTFAVDTVLLDKNGHGIFEGDTALVRGIYLVFFPSRGMDRFELLVDDNQHFSLEADTTNFIKTMKIKNSAQNTAFYEFHNFMSTQTQKNRPLHGKLQLLKDQPKKAKKIREELIENEKVIKAYWAGITEQWGDKLLGVLIKAMTEPIMPEFEIPETITNKDSALHIMRYTWYKDHHFDNIDLKDDRLMRTPFFTPKIEKFMTKTVVQHPDSVLKEGIKLIEASRGSEYIFPWLIKYMFGYKEKSKLMGMSKVFVEISEKYYLSGDAYWADSTFLAKIRDRVSKEENNLIGKPAPKMPKLETYEKQFINLYEIPNKYTIMIFWEPNCGHCKKTVPKLYKSFMQMKKDDIDVQTLAIYSQFDRAPWEKFIEEKEIFDWLNVYDKYYYSNFKVNYDISTTPIIYLLDKDKKIIGKKLAVEQVEQIVYGMEGKKAPVHEEKATKKKDKDKH